MKVIFHVEVGVSRKASVDLKLTGAMPFLPVKDMRIVAKAGDDFRRVQDVLYSEKDGVEVFFEFEDRADRLAGMRKLGWKEDR